MSKFNYQSYCAFMRGKRQEPISEEAFNEMEGINTETLIPPLMIQPRNKSQVKPTMENYVKIQKLKKAKVERKPRVKITDEDMKKKKEEWRKGYLLSEKGRAKRREINARYAERNRAKLNADAVRRYHEKKDNN